LRWKYWKRQKRKISQKEIALLRKHFGNATLRINRQAVLWKFDVDHSHTIKLVDPRQRVRYWVETSDTSKRGDHPSLLVAICVRKFGGICEFEFTRLDAEPLRYLPKG
jgi:hypothetical protein